MVGRSVRFYRALGEALRLRIRVGIKNRLWNRIIPRPETEAAYLLRVGFACDRVRQVRNPAGVQRRRSPRESRHSEIETAPEKMHRAAFPAEPGAEQFENPIALKENTPESVGIFGIISAVRLIAFKRNRVHDFVRRGVDLDR